MAFDVVANFERVAAVGGLLGAAYLGWACHRLSYEVMRSDRQWPRPWPYPDWWLLRWERRLDAEDRRRSAAEAAACSYSRFPTAFHSSAASSERSEPDWLRLVRGRHQLFGAMRMAHVPFGFPGGRRALEQLPEPSGRCSSSSSKRENTGPTCLKKGSDLPAILPDISAAPPGFRRPAT